MTQHDLIVIGAGPGGYVAAIRAAQLGLRVALIEKEKALGGTCLRVGCIPSKALLESSDRFHEARHELARHGVKTGAIGLDLATMLKRKDDTVAGLTDGVAMLVQKNRITRLHGSARFAAPSSNDADATYAVAVDPASGGETTTLHAPRVIIATGSKSAALAGVTLDGDRIGTSTEALSYPEVPGHLVVIGAGYIGLELGSVWQRLGAKVTVLEYLPRILPGMDSELAADALKVFKKQGLEFRLNCRVTGARVEGDANASRARADAGARGGKSERAGGRAATCVVEVEGAEPTRCDRVLLAVGRVPNTDGLALDTIGVQVDAKGRIPVDEHFATAAPGVFAIGDVIRGPMLAHKAEDEGIACAEYLVTGFGHVNYDAIPGVVYTNPEIAAVGKTEDELKEAGVEYRSGVYHFRGNARARALGHVEGRIKVLAHAQTDRILGVHIIGPRAGDLIAEAAVAIEFGASSEDLARCSHAHPTLAEALKEAALAVDRRAIHA
ncbi:MAG: dihydrolipoyl dehydrogenase [Phycisphaerae bacterium]